MRGGTGRLSLSGEGSDYPHERREVRDSSGRIVTFPVAQWQPASRGGRQECVYPRRNATADHLTPFWL